MDAAFTATATATPLRTLFPPRSLPKLRSLSIYHAVHHNRLASLSKWGQREACVWPLLAAAEEGLEELARDLELMNLLPDQQIFVSPVLLYALPLTGYVYTVIYIFQMIARDHDVDLFTDPAGALEPLSESIGVLQGVKRIFWYSRALQGLDDRARGELEDRARILAARLPRLEEVGVISNVLGSYTTVFITRRDVGVKVFPSSLKKPMPTTTDTEGAETTETTETPPEISAIGSAVRIPQQHNATMGKSPVESTSTEQQQGAKPSYAPGPPQVMDTRIGRGFGMVVGKEVDAAFPVISFSPSWI